MPTRVVRKGSEKGSKSGKLVIPTLTLQDGYNTKQAMGYGFLQWRDFFNDRQLLAISLLRSAIAELRDDPTRRAFSTLLSGILGIQQYVCFLQRGRDGGGAAHVLAPYSEARASADRSQRLGNAQEFRFLLKPLSQPTPSRHRLPRIVRRKSTARAARAAASAPRRFRASFTLGASRCRREQSPFVRRLRRNGARGQQCGFRRYRSAVL